MTFLFVFLLVYGSANAYLGIRNWAWLKTVLPLSPILYWLLLFSFSALPVVSRIASRYGMSEVKTLSIIGDWWLAVTYWSVLLWLTVDILRLANRWGEFLPSAASSITNQGLAVNAVLLALLAYGAWNALHPVINRYEITLNKPGGEMRSIKAVLVSDIHVGRIVGNDRVEKLAAAINDLQPDMVFYAGDVIDDDTVYVAENNLLSGLRSVKAPLGSYAVLGNHEYIGGQPEAAAQLMNQAGITVLRDQAVLIRDAFYVAGRDDLSSMRYGAKGRQPLSTILAGTDAARPVILLDHQPSNLDEAAGYGIDLQLSGHTHRGQFFPNNLITRLVYEQDWGYLRKGDYQLIVSCGYGTWGPPVRLGNKPEIVEIAIRFP